MHKMNRTCPVCKQNGKNTSLELRQINLTEAVYICEDRNCIYPIGFQWEYVKNSIFDDESDDSSDDNFKLSSSNSKTNTLNDINGICNNSKILLHEKHKTIKQEKLNISNAIVETPESLRTIINTNDCVNTNENVTWPIESIRKNNVRFSSKTKVHNFSGALPESIVKNAKALSKYFSNTTNQSDKPKTNIKSVFDIIQPPVKKPAVSNKIKKSADDDVLSEKVKDFIISNNTIEHNYSVKKVEFDEVSSDNIYIDSFLDEALKNPPKKINNELTEVFDELLFSNDDTRETKNQGLDLSEMDELLSFL